MKKPRVGIPRALMYYYYYPQWKCFLEELGAEVIVSPKTNKQIVNAGVLSAIDEACLPVKLYYGHVEWLKDKVDYIFIPRVISIERKEYICPKFMGLPDMIRANVSELPHIIDASLDLSKQEKQLHGFVREVGKHFTNNGFKIAMAWRKAQKKQREFLQMVVAKKIPPHEMIEYLEDREPRVLTAQNNQLTIALLGHGYNIYDEYISMNIVKKLRDMNIKVVFPDVLSSEVIDVEAAKLPKRMFWTFGKKNLGGAMHYLNKNENIDGMVHIASFGCGPDSLVGELIYRKARDGEMPILNLTIDEHTGEAGIVTRLEAFIDMLIRRRVVAQ
ncbi:putative nucleotide-binding protein (sugar kinase/HSP70/actin superfamily) [Desulfitispora alkaliphila]|uniref:acyl-CoA dehydratase activase-related protein n=1 Tax=Desulfitispora alkaliphila TaxID=622674 RepID=UPI003D1AC437